MNRYWFKRLLILFGDIVMLSSGFWLALTVRHLQVPSAQLLESHVALFGITIFLWVVAGYINGIYDLNNTREAKGFYIRLFQTSIAAFIIGIIFFYLVSTSTIAPKTILALAVVFGYTLISLWRLLSHRLIGIKKLQSNVMFIGYTKESKELLEILEKNSERGYVVKAIVEPREDKNLKGLSKEISIYNSLRAIRPAISNHSINVVVVAPHLQDSQEAMREMYELLFWPVHILHLPAFYEKITGRIPPSTFSEGWFLEHLKKNNHSIYDKLRVGADYIAGLILGIIFLLLAPIIAISIKLTSKGPIFFKQKRVGLYGQEFMLYKFRSMYALSEDGSAELNGYQFAKKGDKRITTVGKFLRKTRLDELPQIINLVKRDITVVGPRPERPEIVQRLTEEMSYYPLRHIVRPGLTGWAVLHQNYTDNIEASLQKLQYDLYYIKNRSVMVDISILLRTVNIVLRGMGQ